MGSKPMWRCNYCTYHQNPQDRESCGMCSLTRPVAPKPPVPAPKLKLTVEEANKYFNECLVECPKYGVRPKDYEFIEHIRLKWAYCQKTNLTKGRSKNSSKNSSKRDTLRSRGITNQLRQTIPLPL